MSVHGAVRPGLCTCTFVFVGANGRIGERGFGDWRIGGLVTVERGGYMRFYESTGEGFVLFSCEALPRALELPKATEIRLEAARPLRIYPHSCESRRFPMPDTISKHRWQLTRNAYVMRKDVELLVGDQSQSYVNRCWFLLVLLPLQLKIQVTRWRVSLNRDI